MPSSSTLFAFTLVTIGIMVMPGPSNFFLLAHGIGHDRRAALAAMAGISVAAGIRVLLTAAGLTAVLASSPVAFQLIKWGGVGYLAWLGVKAIRTVVASGTAAHQAVSPRHSMRKGFLIGIANPKMIVFFVAFFPQFVDPARGAELTQILVLGAIFWVVGVLWDLSFAVLSGAVGAWLQQRPRLRDVQPRVEGVAYLGLAVWAAV